MNVSETPTGFTFEPDVEQLNLCACLGPQYNEPVCPCQMQLQGLQSSPERLEREAYLASPASQAEQETLLKQFQDGLREAFFKGDGK